MMLDSVSLEEIIKRDLLEAFNLLDQRPLRLQDSWTKKTKMKNLFQLRRTQQHHHLFHRLVVNQEYLFHLLL